MPLSANFFGDIGQGISSFFGAVGSEKEAGAYRKAAGFASANAGLAKRATDINTNIASRNIYQALGAERADTASAGFQMSGSALDLIRSSTEQGSLSKALIETQGAQQVLGYQSEAEADRAKASAADDAADGGFLSSILSIAGAAITLL